MTSSAIQKLILSSPVMVFMKGIPDAPLCGFSKTVVEILRSHDVNFGFFDVLGNESVRQEIKLFSDWPTFPQVYVQGTLIGGCDIIKALNASGELTEKLCFSQNASSI